MRKLLILFIVSLFVWACDKKTSETEGDKYSISGKIKTPEKGAYLYLEEFDDQNLKKIDSVKVKDDGSYKMEGKIKEPGFYQLNVFNKQSVVFVLENKPIEVNADGTQQGASEIKGSKATNDFLGVNKLMEEFQSEMQAMQNGLAMETNIDTPKVEKEFELLRSKYTNRVKDSIRDMGPTVTAIFATNFLDKEAEAVFFDSLATVFEKEIPDSKYSKQFVENVKSLRKLSVGKVAPDFTLMDPSGQELKLVSLRGKYVLIDFWASWCGPCRQENPNVVRMYNKFKNKDFEILGVSLDNDKFKWEQAISKDGLIWKHVSDLKGWESAAASLYNVSAIPATYLIDKEGKIIAKNLRGKELEEKLGEILL